MQDQLQSSLFLISRKSKLKSNLSLFSFCRTLSPCDNGAIPRDISIALKLKKKNHMIKFFVPSDSANYQEVVEQGWKQHFFTEPSRNQTFTR